MSIRKEIERLERRIKTLEARDEDLMRTVMLEALAIYLEKEVEFSMSTDGKIKELIK